MTLGQKTLHLNGMSWHCLSIFYARQDNAALLDAIGEFFETNGALFAHWSLWFSLEQGERVDLVMVSREGKGVKAVELLEDYFGLWLSDNPSGEVETPTPGTMLWKHFPNNSLEWCAFELPPFMRESQKRRDFAQATSSLAVSLWDKDVSFDDNIASISVFMWIKLQKTMGEPFPEIEDSDTTETLRSYWDYEEDNIIEEWLRCTEINRSIMGILLDYEHLSLFSHNLYMPI